MQGRTIFVLAGDMGDSGFDCSLLEAVVLFIDSDPVFYFE